MAVWCFERFRSRFFRTLFLAWCVGPTFAHAGLHERAECGTNPRWAPTIKAWEAADTDNNLHRWWNSVMRSNRSSPRISLTNELARQFGSGYSDYSCSITDQGSCIIPGCQDYVDAGDPVWAYLALNAIVNMNTFLNRLYEGIGNGQDDFGNEASAIAQTFFPWQDPTVHVGEALFWVDATVGALFGFLAPETRLGIAGKDAIVAFANAGFQEAQLSLKVDPGLTLEQGTATIEEAGAQSAKACRKKLEKWATRLFSGRKDSTGRTILDYLRGGSFIVPSNISNGMIESFWEDSLTGRTINSEWVTQRYFVTFARTKHSRTNVGPRDTKYFSHAGGGVYYLYAWKNGGLEMPEAMTELQSYGIRPEAVTESSARAFEFMKYNYTNNVALQQLHASLFNATSNPVLDGARWPGNWNITVCDMGDHLEWNGRYGESSMAPCCCGHNCEDTKIFVQLANLHGDQSYLKQCRKQLKGTDLDFKGIDYGFKIDSWRSVYIAAIILPIVAAVVIGFWICACCASDY